MGGSQAVWLVGGERRKTDLAP